MSTGAETDMRARVLQRVDALREELFEALAAMIRIRSINPSYPGQVYDELVGGESEMAHAMAALYERAGAEVDLFSLAPGRENAVGLVRGAGGGRSLILNGHVDVVPAGSEECWSREPFGGEVEDDRIWGRGASDMKAGLAAQAFAAIALRDVGARLAGDLILEAVVGEENLEHQLGTSAAIERGYRADAGIVGEPSGWFAPLSVMPCTPGLLVMSVQIEGRATHAGMRGQTIRAGGPGAAIGVSAIDKGYLIYDALRRLEDEWGVTKRHPLFPPGHFTIYAGVVNGGARDVLTGAFIPDQMSFLYGVFHPPGEDPANAKREIEEQVAAVAASDGWLRDHPPVVTWEHEVPGCEVDPGHPLCTTLAAGREEACAETSLSGPAEIVGFASVADATWMCAAGIPTLCFGPGSLVAAHSVDESCVLDEIVCAARTYALAAIDWCGLA